MSKAKELFDETAIYNMQKAMILFKEDTDIIKAELDYAEKCHKLEEELGCPLEVVFKALTNGIYNKNIYDELTNFKCKLNYKNEELGYYLSIININAYVMVKDYKKTWWLKEDRSE